MSDYLDKFDKIMEEMIEKYPAQKELLKILETWISGHVLWVLNDTKRFTL